ncbi:transcriptional regulator [Porphyromonas gingivalis]|uniref:winged helix-turn-helix domain-containing protein n=1 Tax=Porphyromonas gingivalis TaxID=837 RepID=UPI0009750183|nr:transcriptional regulator [Porphyromonas gingivalis]SJL26947.1 transcriptional regulator [Porphyromonas gingivalis]
MLRPLDPLLMSELRLAIMSVLMSVEEADFLYLKEVTGATSGNISVQLDKLSTAGYIEIEKGYNGKRPRTTCRATDAGCEAFSAHFEALKSYLPTDSTH